MAGDARRDAKDYFLSVVKNQNLAVGHTMNWRTELIAQQKLPQPVQAVLTDVFQEMTADGYFGSGETVTKKAVDEAWGY